MQFLRSAGYTEWDIEGIGLIMSDVAIEFKGELFYGDVITAYVAAGDFSRAGFIFYYKLTKDEKVIALAKTGMVCYDYGRKKVVSVPGKAVGKLSQLSATKNL
jgi:acyl-CoA thioesterase FadM